MNFGGGFGNLFRFGQPHAVNPMHGDGQQQFHHRPDTPLVRAALLPSVCHHTVSILSPNLLTPPPPIPVKPASSFDDVTTHLHFDDLATRFHFENQTLNPLPLNSGIQCEHLECNMTRKQLQSSLKESVEFENKVNLLLQSREELQDQVNLRNLQVTELLRVNAENEASLRALGQQNNFLAISLELMSADNNALRNKQLGQK